jgi:hypothetical protein
VLASIAGYYARVTGSPMGRLVGVAMLATVGSALYQLVSGSLPRHWAALALAACAAPVVLARLRVFPNAVRLGARGDPPAVQSDLARAIGYDHLACLALIGIFCALQLTARSSRRALRRGEVAPGAGP